MRRLTYEFIIPSEIFLIDPSEWNPLFVVRNDLHMLVRKPLTGQRLVKVAGTIGNEGVDLHYSIMRVDVEVDDCQSNPEWYVPFQAIKECLVWIRVAAGQYWVGAMMSGTNNLTRGSIITGSGTYTNFGAYQTPIITHPLSIETWQWIGGEMAQGNLPSVPDTLFCDSLLSFRDHDFMQATLLLGVTCEIELNAFIDDLLSIQSEPMKKLYNSSRYKFDWKLRNMPGILGAESYQEHNEQWANQLCKLYELRGSVAHRAESLIYQMNDKTGKKEKVPVGFEHVSTFMFAADDFLHWTKAQRARLGLPAARALDSRIRYALGA